jgi:hypothetical protein
MNKRFRQLFAGAVAAMSLLTTPLAWAGYSCTGIVSGTQIAPNGNVGAANMAGMTWIFLCNVSISVNGVDPSTCKAIYATLLAAEAQGRGVTLWLNDEPNTCASHPEWGMLTGWYWGPMLAN